MSDILVQKLMFISLKLLKSRSFWGFRPPPLTEAFPLDPAKSLQPPRIFWEGTYFASPPPHFKIPSYAYVCLFIPHRCHQMSMREGGFSADE